jgi:Site-specific recombinases, DNA invertase Pin homologs
MRVSTEDQVKEGFSINAQKEKLTKYAEVNDWDIYDYYIDEGVSGKNIKNRPEMSRLIKDVNNDKIRNILVYKLDRLTRNVSDLINLIDLFEKQNCAFNSQTEKIDTSNAVGRMFVKMLGIFAEFERENLAERVAFGYEQKTREGNYTNTNGVYGYNYIIGKGLEVNEDEKEIVKDIYESYLSGNSMLSICKKLNTEKISTKRGGIWAGSTIRSILTNPLYIGKIRYSVNNKSKQFEVAGKNIETILDEKLWKAVQNRIKKKNLRHKMI